MKFQSRKLQPILYLILATVFLLPGILPRQSAHAQNDVMNSSDMTSAINCCTVPNAPAALQYKQEARQKVRDDADKSPRHTRHDTWQPEFPKLPISAVNYVFGGQVPWPPDFIKLFANFRF